GKKGMLEKSYYENLIKDNLEKEQGYKIFMFHSLLSEFKPKDMEKVDSQPLSLLPKNFDYYAGGHPHFAFNKKEDGYGTIAYPGPLFPNNFAELEKLKRGGFYIIEDDKPEWQPVQIYNVFSIDMDCDHKSPEQAEKEIMEKIKDNEFNNTIVTIRLKGILGSGKPSDINFKGIFRILYNKSAYFAMKNTMSLKTKEFEEIRVQAESVDDIEEKLIKEHLGQINVKDLTLEKEEKLTKELMTLLSIEKKEDEKSADFEKRIKENISMILKF
ncbi:MAG: hypothetical protein KAU20_04785, partial [Nanoarchaeota archaeon]|nr:hypothetical protein [Nanoarchaeota archaeon]